MPNLLNYESQSRGVVADYSVRCCPQASLRSPQHQSALQCNRLYQRRGNAFCPAANVFAVIANIGMVSKAAAANLKRGFDTVHNRHLHVHKYGKVFTDIVNISFRRMRSDSDVQTPLSGCLNTSVQSIYWYPQFDRCFR